jgi:uncharacterized protein YbaP (TraB family)
VIAARADKDRNATMGTLPFLLAGSIAAAQPAQAQLGVQMTSPVHPALWVISDSDTTIYLFGTFHALDGTTEWFKGDVKTAFDNSGELILETLVPEFPKAGEASGPIAPLKARFAKRGPGPATSNMVSVPPQASFLASTKLVMAASHARGMSSALGADALLRETAEEAGKPVAGLESFEFQMKMFSSLPASSQPLPPQDPETLRQVSILLAQLQDAWNRGDPSAFDPMLAQMRAETPSNYETMFVDRNQRWAKWIANRLQQPGVVFVAVGTGHLAGPDSVQNQLAMLGIKSGRVN